MVREMKIAVRFDDITADMDWESFEFFKGLLDEVGITALLGIVPDNRDPNLHCEAARTDFYDKMKQLEEQGYILAMHGCRHCYCTKKGGLFPLNQFSEFAGRSYEEQLHELQAGKEILREQGIETDFFMAPAHTYDKNTLKALKTVGFTRMTDGFGKRPYRDFGLTFYPISFKLSRSFQIKDGYTTMVIHSNTVKKEDREHYRKLFLEHKDQWISYEDYLKVEAVDRKRGARFTEYALAKMKQMLVKVKGI